MFYDYCYLAEDSLKLKLTLVQTELKLACNLFLFLLLSLLSCYSAAKCLIYYQSRLLNMCERFAGVLSNVQDKFLSRDMINVYVILSYIIFLILIFTNTRRS